MVISIDPSDFGPTSGGTREDQKVKETSSLSQGSMSARGSNEILRVSIGKLTLLVFYRRGANLHGSWGGRGS